MKSTYYIRLTFHLLIWAFVLFRLSKEFNEPKLISICLFLIIMFIIPLLKNKTIFQTILFTIQVLTTIIIFYSANNVVDPFIFLIHTLILVEVIFYLSRLYSVIVFVTQLGSVIVLITVASYDSFYLIAWSVFYYLLIMSALQYYQVINKRQIGLQKQNDALLDEYRRMKRQLMTEEEQVRQDERIMIGHEIHDSVGHKLTALIMQLEAFRLAADEKDAIKIKDLKELAEESLNETRTAVKSFKERNVGGLHGVIRLIRKLELESFMKISFSVKHRAFAAPLTGEQSFAVYRAIQEALTNIMKHSSTREAQVSFESPGGSIFRFEVSNVTTTTPYFQEGYGLKAMRERIEKAGGSLEIYSDKRVFIVRGMIRLKERSG